MSFESFRPFSPSGYNPGVCTFPVIETEGVSRAIGVVAFTPISTMSPF